MTNEETFILHMKMFDEYVEGVARMHNLSGVNTASDHAQEVILTILQLDFQNLIYNLFYLKNKSLGVSK